MLDTMKTSEKSFDQAWKKLTTEGKMYSENTPENFTPAGIRKDVKVEGPLYHGTKADLKPVNPIDTEYYVKSS